MLKKAAFVVVAPVLLGALTLLLLPSPIDPVAYAPPPATALAGVLAPNDALRAAEILAAGQVRGPEDVAVDDAGQMYVGTEDGKIVRVSADGGKLETWAVTGGRPLGLDFGPDGRLIVADGTKGLLAIEGGEVTVLATEAGGEPFGFADDLDVASDGRVYFSDASARYGPEEYLYDLLEARPHGRLLRYDPATGDTEVLLDELYFANGVALSQNEDFVLVNETYRYRIVRYWLAGPRAGTSEVFLDNLPGFPDGVSANGRGTFWVALFTVRNPEVDRMHPSPMVKRLLAKLPKTLWPTPEPYGLVLAVDEDGTIVRSLHDPTGEHVQQVTSAEEYDGVLYLGNLTLDRFARLEL